MNDQDQPRPTTKGYAVSVDLRDVVGGAGILLALAGASAFHWGAGVFVAGAGLFAVAAKLTRA